MRAAAAVVLLLMLVPVLPCRAAAQYFRVNTFTPELQANPSVTGQGDGFVVVWESLDQDGDYIGVIGRRFGGAGAPAGGEFQVNQYVFGPQALPAVATLADGGFVVVWQGYGEGGDYADIFARRFGSSGTPASGQFQVNEAVEIYQIDLAAAVSATTDGGFAVVWDDLDDVHARRYDSAGAARGGSFVVNVATYGTQVTAAIAPLPDGGFVIAWADGYYLADGQDGAGYGIFGRRFSSAGAPLGGEFLINSSTLGDQYGPAIAAAAGGGFVVAWQSYGHDGGESALFARRYDSSGAPLGGELEVDRSDAADAGPPAIAAGAGGFVVGWSSLPRNGGSARVLARRFDAAGAPVGDAAPVQAGATADQFEPAAAALAGGELAIVWRDDAADGDSAGIVGRLIDLTPPASTPTAPATATGSAAVTETSTAEPATVTPSPRSTPSAAATDSPTAASTSTATAVAPSCAGDCSGDGAVTVDELILAVNIALGSQPIGRCAAADRDADLQLSIAELIGAVSRALIGCA